MTRVGYRGFWNVPLKWEWLFLIFFKYPWAKARFSILLYTYLQIWLPHVHSRGRLFMRVSKETRGTCLGAGINNYQPLWSAGFIPPHIRVSKITWPTSGLQRLCFDLWLNRMNDLRRTAFREDCLAIRLESSDVYALRGVSGWVCAAEILWEKGRYTLPHG